MSIFNKFKGSYTFYMISILWVFFIMYTLFVKLSSINIGIMGLLTALFVFLSKEKRKKEENLEKENVIIAVFKNEIKENEEQLKKMLEDYGKARKLKQVKSRNVVYYRDLSFILCERVLKDVNPKRTDCHIKIEELRSTLSTINNFNKICRERDFIIPKGDIMWMEDLITQANALDGIIRVKLSEFKNIEENPNSLRKP